MLEALLGTEPGRDVARLIARHGAHRGRARSATRASCKDLITNFNTTMARVRVASRATCARSIRQLAPTLRQRQRRVRLAQRARSRRRARSRARSCPACARRRRRSTPSFPWIAQTRKLSRRQELGGLAEELSPATRDLARLIDRAIELLPQTDLAVQVRRATSSCPTGDIVINDEFTTGAENYKEFFYALVGLAGEGQNFDGNGMYVRFQTGGGSQTSRSARLERPPARLFGNSVAVAARQPAAYPGQAPAVQARRALLQAEAAGRQRPGRGEVAADAARPAPAARRPRRGTARRKPTAALRPHLRPFLARRRRAVRTAIRKHLPDFLAIIGLLVVAVAVVGGDPRPPAAALPGWVPVIGQDFFELDAEMSTRPGGHAGPGPDGQHRGRRGGRDRSVKLEDGKAIIGMKIKPKYDRVYKRRVDPAAARRPA